MFWFLPLAVAAVAAIPALVMIRRLSGEVLGLRRELDEFSSLRPALVELRTDARALRAAAAVRAAQLPGRS